MDFFYKGEKLTAAKLNELVAMANRSAQTLGPYDELPNIVLTPEAQGYAIDKNGNKVAKSGWAIASFMAEKGNEYHFKPGVTDGNVSIFAEFITREEVRTIDYADTYEEVPATEEQEATSRLKQSVATYNGKTYTYVYEYDEMGALASITETISGVTGSKSVGALPYSYKTNTGSYVPLTVLNANAALPADGYCRFISHFKGNAAIKVVVSYKVASADINMKVSRDGAFANLSTQLGNQSVKIDRLSERVENAEQESNKRLLSLENWAESNGMASDKYYIQAQDCEQASPELDAVQTNGSVAMLKELYRPFLIDHKDNADVTTEAFELKRNNWLRFADGSFAPTVGISEEQRAECDVDLYLDAEHTELYCAAGEFEAERFYREYGVSQKLYNGDGQEVRVLRPWETTSKDYSVKVGAVQPLWISDDYDASGLLIRGVLKSYAEIGGVKPRLLMPTALSPSCDCTIREGSVDKFRSAFYVYDASGNNNCRGNSGQYGGTMFKKADRCYPRVNDVQQVTSMGFARNNNADTTKPYPFAECGFFAYNAFLVAQELTYGTNYIFNPDQGFSSGISSNNACNNEATWMKYGGVRYKTAGMDWAYTGWNGAPNIFNSSGTRVGHCSTFLNSEWPKMACNEAQMALSFAVETKVSEGAWFEFYGGSYCYKNVPIAEGVADGRMNAIVYKKCADSYVGKNAAGEVCTWQIEVMLRMGVIDGLCVSGDIFHYRGGGHETVMTCKNSQAGGGGNLWSTYMETDQTKWVRETQITVQTPDAKFPTDFEAKYEKITDSFVVNGEGWVAKRFGNSWLGIKLGGGAATYTGGFNWRNNYGTTKIDSRDRRACRCGGYAIAGPCGGRYVYAAYAASIANRFIGGSAQVLFRVGGKMQERKALQAQ